MCRLAAPPGEHQALSPPPHPPPHPPPGVVGAAGLVVAGTGHGMLGEWGAAAPMLAVDATCMGLIGLEAAGRGTGRIDVFFTAVMLSAVFKAYAVSDGHRRAKRRRERLERVAGAQ